MMRWKNAALLALAVTVVGCSSNSKKELPPAELPEFTTEVEQPLNEVIAGLGAPTMFKPGADFSRLADGNMFVSKMFQKAKIEVSESTHRLLARLAERYPLVVITNGNLDLAQESFAKKDYSKAMELYMKANG